MNEKELRGEKNRGLPIRKIASEDVSGLDAVKTKGGAGNAKSKTLQPDNETAMKEDVREISPADRYKVWASARAETPTTTASASTERKREMSKSEKKQAEFVESNVRKLFGL